jgi:uncharacterized protein (TIGR02996 family)
MSIEEGLLQDVIENPDDDAPRLIYADWLEEFHSGDRPRARRAELIREQIALAREHPAYGGATLVGSGRAENDMEKCGELLARVGRAAALARELFHLGTYGLREAVVRRGFVEHASVRLSNWERFGPIWRAHPVRSLRLTKAFQGRGARLAEILGQDRLESLELGEVSASDVARLDGMAQLRRLRLVKLNRTRPDDLIALLASPLPPVRVLDLTGVPRDLAVEGDGAGCAVAVRLFDDRLTSRLAEQPSLSGLRRLHLCSSEGSAGVLALARSPHLTSLTHLDLSSSRLTDDDLRALLSARFAPNLHTLEVRYNYITGLGTAVLAEAAPLLAKLRRLDVRGIRISRDDWRRLESAFGDRIVFREWINEEYAARRSPFG